MLRKYYNCNNSVTNVESGSRSTIVKSGDQKHHYQNWAKSSHAHACVAHQSRPWANKRVGKLEKAGQAGQAES